MSNVAMSARRPPRYYQTVGNVLYKLDHSSIKYLNVFLLITLGDNNK